MNDTSVCVSKSCNQWQIYLFVIEGYLKKLLDALRVLRIKNISLKLVEMIIDMYLLHVLVTRL